MVKISLEGIAPCGVLCFTCPSLLKGTCLGCRSNEKQKRTSKLACKIRTCCLSKQFITCSECNEEKKSCKNFYNKLLRTHRDDPKYQYRRDTFGHHELINKEGLNKALEILDKRWACPECGGRIQMYFYKCSECGRDFIDEMQGFTSFKVTPISKHISRKASKKMKPKEKPTKFQLDNALIAPCGIYCGACRHYLLKKKNLLEKRGFKQGCDGCRIRNKNCAFIKKDCPWYKKKKVQFCYECDEFPCDRMYRMESIYQEKYKVSMIGNLERIKEVGSQKWLQEQQELYTCPKCGGEISVHDAECFDCGLKINPNKN